MNELRQQTSDALNRLASWAVATAPADIPGPVLQRGARVLADDLAAIVGARAEPEIVAFHERVLAKPREPEATVFRGGRARTDRLSAAVANAVAADWIELDEGYRPTSCHAGLYVIPALIAEAEAVDLPARDMLRALVLSYEITTRLARAWKLLADIVQPHGRFAAVGAAAGVGLARGLAAGLFAQALGTAVTLTGLSPRTHLAEGTLSRNVWPAAGAWSGMMSVEWAQCGIGGATTAFYDGYSALLQGAVQPQILVDGLGERWAILDGYTKIYACCQHLHSAVEAAMGLRGEIMQHATLEDIEAITVATHPLAMPLQDARPVTTLGAKFSMPHAMAAAIAMGSAGADAFASSTLGDSRLQALKDKVRIEPFTPELPPPHDRPARVTVRLRDGRSFSRECLSAQGGPDRPLGADTVFAKVDSLAGPVYPAMRRVLQALHEMGGAEQGRGWSAIVAQMCEKQAKAETP